MPTPQVAIIADLSHYSARIRLEAFARHGHGLGWQLRFFEHTQDLLPRLRDGAEPFDGLFICNMNPETGLHAALAGLPRRPATVEASRKTATPWPQVFLDETKTAAMALEHLRWQQREHYGFLGRAGAMASHEREAALSDALEPEDAPLRSHHLDMDAPGRAREELAQFLAEFPRPGCVLCFEDRIAELATEECHRQQLRVPDDVAILSCGDDPLLTSLAEAPLSCIVFPSEEIGQAAAHLLHRLMRGEHAPAAVQRVPPRELRVRHSTDPAASADRVLGRAIVHMRQHLGQALPVTAIAAAAGVSRRALETRFREKLRKSIREQLQELRMEHATGLIRSTNLKLEDIALQSGFSSAATFSRAYRAHYGVPPSAHR